MGKSSSSSDCSEINELWFLWQKLANSYTMYPRKEKKKSTWNISHFHSFNRVERKRHSPGLSRLGRHTGDLFFPCTGDLKRNAHFLPSPIIMCSLLVQGNTIQHCRDPTSSWHAALYFSRVMLPPRSSTEVAPSPLPVPSIAVASCLQCRASGGTDNFILCIISEKKRRNIM